MEVKRCAAPEGEEETFVLCRSEGRKEKEQAILNRFVERLERALNKLVLQAERGEGPQSPEGVASDRKTSGTQQPCSFSL